MGYANATPFYVIEMDWDCDDLICAPVGLGSLTLLALLFLAQVASLWLDFLNVCSFPWWIPSVTDI